MNQTKIQNIIENSAFRIGLYATDALRKLYKQFIWLGLAMWQRYDKMKTSRINSNLSG